METRPSLHLNVSNVSSKADLLVARMHIFFGGDVRGEVVWKNDYGRVKQTSFVPLSSGQAKTGWWFQTFFILTPIWGRFPI